MTAPAPPKGGDGSRGAAGNVGGYNSFWLDPGSTYTIVNGEARTSLVVDPPDGRLPALTPAARQRMGALLARPSAENDPGLDPTPGAYDDPERRPLGERCLLGFGSAAGPPALAELLLQQPPQDRADAGPRTDPERDGARRTRGPYERSAPAAHTSASGPVTRSAAGKATRWSSTRRTSTPIKSATSSMPLRAGRS